MFERVLLLGILASAWKGSVGRDDFTGQQIVVFGTSVSDNGNGISPYIDQTLRLAGFTVRGKQLVGASLTSAYSGGVGIASLAPCFSDCEPVATALIYR